jgi:SOS-response transcriptional repressor LexA
LTTEHLRKIERNPHSVLPGLKAKIRELAEQYCVFHWHLEFPAVFGADGKGGFDLILGNPPWERVKLQEKEFFAERSPDVANASNAAKRKVLIAQLATDNPGLMDEFHAAQRRAEGASHFMRNSAIYPLCGRGDINLYAVFAEATRQRLAPSGWMGLVLPTGIATDDTTKFYFQAVVDTCSLISLFDFENRQGLFPEVDSRMKFCLFTAGSGRAAPAGRKKENGADFVFFAHSVEDLQDSERRFRLTADDIKLLNPHTRTCPIFRSRRDAVLTTAIYRRVPVFSPKGALNKTTKGAWDATLFTMLHSAGAAHLFRDNSALQSQAVRCGKNWRDRDNLFVSLYEGKMFHQFDHRFASVVLTDNLSRPAQPIEATDEERQSPDWFPEPRVWVNHNEISVHCPDSIRTTWFLGYKDVGSSTNERTLIATILPEVAIVDSVNLVGISSGQAEEAGCLLANFNSFALDYVVRQKTGGLHIKFYLLNQLPVLPAATYVQSCKWSSNGQHLSGWLLSRILELTYTAWDLEPFALECGFNGPPFRWDKERRFQLRCELDAAFFHLYLGSEEAWRRESESLTKYFPAPRDAVAYIMDTFPIVKRKDEKKFGTYRTKNMILKIYDDLAESQRTGRPYISPLNPPPGPPTDEHGHFIPMSQWDPNQWPSHIHPPRDTKRQPIPMVAQGGRLTALDESRVLRRVTPRRDERYKNCAPMLDLKIAAGAFSEDQLPEFEEWVEINTAIQVRKGMFVARVIGRSMERLIPDGAYCLFQFKAPQMRNDMVGLFQLHTAEDPEQGGSFTVKRLKLSTRQDSKEGSQRGAMLIPENPAFDPIPVKGDDVKFVAEFLEVLRPLTDGD